MAQNFPEIDIVRNRISSVLLNTLKNKGRLFGGEEFVFVRKVRKYEESQYPQENSDGAFDNLKTTNLVGLQDCINGDIRISMTSPRFLDARLND